MAEGNMRGASGAVSLAQVAAEAGVSVATVSRIVNGETKRASGDTVARVRQIVEALGYRPNHVGRSLRSRESRIVAMLAPNLDNPAMAAIAASTEAALRAAGYVMILCDTHDRPELQDEYLHAMRAQFVQGYVLVSAVPSPELHAATMRSEPLVFVNRRPPRPAGAFVGIDNHRAGADVANHMLERGIDDFALIRPSSPSQPIAERIEGFLAGLASRGIAREDVRIAHAPGLTHLDVGYASARALRTDGDWPAGLMCPSDLMAYGAYRLATEEALAVPARCRIVGIDDNPLNRWIAPWLSSVRIPYLSFGAAIVSVLQACWAGETPQDRILPHELIAR